MNFRRRTHGDVGKSIGYETSLPKEKRQLFRRIRLLINSGNSPDIGGIRAQIEEYSHLLDKKEDYIELINNAVRANSPMLVDWLFQRSHDLIQYGRDLILPFNTAFAENKFECFELLLCKAEILDAENRGIFVLTIFDLDRQSINNGIRSNSDDFINFVSDRMKAIAANEESRKYLNPDYIAKYDYMMERINEKNKNKKNRQNI